MKGNSGKKILKLFDYFKHAFATNVNNRQLYKPQIIYLLLRGLLIFLSGLTVVELSSTMWPFVGNTDFTKFFSLLWGEFFGTPLLIMVITILVMLFGSTYVEAGLYSMYAKLASDDHAAPIFAEGANRYFLSFLGGNILIGLFWFIAFLPFILIGLLTLTLGFIWLPIIVSALLMVWKAAVVTDDKGVLHAFSASFAFGKRHFVPANVFIILRAALSSIGNGGGSGNSGSSSNITNNFNDAGNGMNLPPFNGGGSPGFPGGPDFPMGTMDNGFNFGIFRVIFTAVISVISLMSIIIGLIHMIFEIFFGLTTVIIYQDDWYIEETDAVMPQTLGDPAERSVE